MRHRGNFRAPIRGTLCPADQVNQQLLLRNEYLAAENRILRAQLPKRLRLTDPQRCTLAEIGKRLGRKALEQVACVVKPDTILGWYRRLIAQKFDGSRYRAAHMAVLAGADFFTVEVLTWRGLITYYVLFFLHVETRRVSLAGITRHPTEEWMTQMGRNAIDETSGICANIGTCFTTAIRSSARSSGRRWQQEGEVLLPNARCNW